MNLARFWVEVNPKVDPAKAKREIERDMSKVNVEDSGRKAGSRFTAGFSASLKGLGAVMATVVSAKALTGISNLAQEASDLGETISKTDNIFGKNAQAIENWAGGAATSMGISKQAALDGASAFGNFFDQIGIGQKQSVKMSKGLVKLSSDLASFNNADPAQVMEAFQSATRGEYDSLQQFIPTVNAATVQTEALRLSHKKNTKDLTEADKALALYSLAQRDAGKATGDFARTSGGLANQQRILKANVANLRATVGQALLPAFQETAKVLNEQVIPPVAAFAREHAPAVRDAIAKIVPTALQFYNILAKGDFTGGPFAEDSPMVDRLFDLREAFQQIKPSVEAFFASMKEQGVSGNLESMQESLTDLMPLIKEFLEQAHGVGPALDVASTVLKFFADNADTLAKFMPLLVAGFIAYKVAVLAANVATAAAFPLKIAEIAANRKLTQSNLALVASREGLTASTVKGTVAEAASTTTKNAGTVATARSRIATIASTVAIKAWGIALKVAMGPIGWIILAITLVVTGLIALYKNNETARRIMDRAWAGIKAAIALAWSAIKAIFGFFVQYVKDIWTAVKTLGGIVASVWNNIGKVISGAWNNVIRPALKGWASTWLTIVGVIVTGASKALGWIPGVGDKLKTAEKAFNIFRDKVNQSLDGIKDEQVGIGAKITFPKDWQNYRSGERMATGGSVMGPGTGTSDSIPAMLSNGEHVWTAREVRAAGGHGAVESMRRGVLGMARGGPVRFGVNANLPSGGAIADWAGAISGVFKGAAASFARTLQKQFTFGGSVVPFARAMAGRPYIWGSAGPMGFDCSGFVSALVNVARGRNPFQRLGTTGTFPWPGFAAGPGRFMVGSFRGNPGHMAATVGGVNMESTGSRGVLVGGGARGAYSSLFGGNVYHLKGFARGGAVKGDAPFDLLNPRGKEFLGRDLMRQMFGDHPHYAFARGGVLSEPVFGIGRSGRTYSFAENGPETITPGRGGATLVNNGVISTQDVENWFVGVQRNVRRKGRG